MANLTLYFDGLCGFANRGQHVEAYVFSYDHGQQLLIPTDVVDPNKTTWAPDRIGSIVDGGKVRQIGVWLLTGIEVEFADGTGQPRWEKPEKAIEFSKEHPKATTKSKKEIKDQDPKVGIVTLLGGGTTLIPQDSSHLCLVKAGMTSSRPIAEVVEWRTSSNTPTVRNVSKNSEITLRVGPGRSWWATISNVLPSLHGHGFHHFRFYYEAVQLAEGDSQMTVERCGGPDGAASASTGGSPTPYLPDVYDCVPPVIFP